MIFLYLKRVVVFVIFGCFLGHAQCMEADGDSYVALAEGRGSINGLGGGPQKEQAKFQSLRDIKVPATGLSESDEEGLSQAITKMLNFTGGRAEFYYSVKAIINPGSGTQDARIQKYVNKWCIKPELYSKLTEENLGNIVGRICKGKGINLDKVLTIATALGDIHVTRVMLTAGVKATTLDKKYIDQWASVDYSGCWKNILQECSKGKHE